ncbi:hypothetical protein [Prochlorococcus sp. MIT 1303]|uniref:hypothetical protein n=1 Tax=Prochlorococcus sp. MIT 1303 TaxID=1723647 RepID=UPI0007B36EDF|nr:hypothetical protein [Prochlorococcus sp. MIT 1303]KZR64499.1 hypothetical protein PMIT1303_01544 [Prochlorococcus sp. MIT 1303]
MTSRDVNPGKLSELGSQDILDQDTAIAEIIQMAVEADDGFVITADEALQFISQMDENDEFSDIELGTEALGAVAGGGSLDIHPNTSAALAAVAGGGMAWERFASKWREAAASSRHADQ